MPQFAFKLPNSLPQTPDGANGLVAVRQEIIVANLQYNVLTAGNQASDTATLAASAGTALFQGGGTGPGPIYVGSFTELAIDVKLTTLVGGTSPTVTPTATRYMSDGVTKGKGIWTATALNAAGAIASSSQGIGGSDNNSVGQYIVIAWTATGAPTSFSLQVSIIGK